MDARAQMRSALDFYLKADASRRTLLRAALAAGGMAAIAPFVREASAAAQAATPAASPVNETVEWAAAPVKFVWVDFAEPTALDPAIVQDSNSFAYARNVYEPLMEIDPAKLELIPALATGYKISGDGKTYTFTLRQGVTFHSGNAFTADDVKATLERLKTINQGPAFLVTDIANIAVVDPATLTITTTAPDPFLPAHLVKIGIVSAKTVTSNTQGGDLAKAYFSNQSDGTGPYKLDSYQRGTQINLVKNANWWKGWQPGSIDELVMTWSSETSTRVQMLEKGDADLIGWIPPTEAQRVSQEPGFSLAIWKTFDTDPAIYLNTAKAPTNNASVRQALTAAFDYQAMIDYNKGYATTPAGPVPSDFPGGAQGLAPFARDLAKAKSILKTAGIDPSTITLNFVVPSGFASFAFGATVFQASMQELGITVNSQEVPWAQMLELYKSPDTAPNATAFAQSPFGLDPIQFVGQFYKTGATYNMALYSNPAVDAKIAQAQTTIDEAARNQILADIQHTVVQEAVNIWTCRPQTLDAVPNHVKGYVLDPTDYRWATKFYLIRIAKH